MKTFDINILRESDRDACLSYRIIKAALSTEDFDEAQEKVESLLAESEPAQVIMPTEAEFELALNNECGNEEGDITFSAGAEWAFNWLRIKLAPAKKENEG
jgi:hypothetical protein